MSAAKHQINGELVMNSDGARPPPVLANMHEQVSAERTQTAQDNGTQSVTNGKRRWSKNDNRLVMECYLRSNPNVRGYRRSMEGKGTR